MVRRRGGSRLQLFERGNRNDLWDNYGFCTIPQPDQPISR